MQITLHKQDGANNNGLARRGTLHLTHGDVHLPPAFMPVGTYGTVKASKQCG